MENALFIFFYYAEWCQYSVLALPMWRELLRSFNNKLIGKLRVKLVAVNIDVDYYPRNLIIGVPTFHFILNGQQMDLYGGGDGTYETLKNNIYHLSDRLNS